MDDWFFHDCLDEAADDAGARLLLGEWLRDAGDALGDGLIWMARQGKYPKVGAGYDTPWPPTWDWWSVLPGWNGEQIAQNDRSDRISPELMSQLNGHRHKSKWWDLCSYAEFSTRRDAEEALCRAFDALR